MSSDVHRPGDIRSILTYTGHVADHNDRGVAGARLVGRMLSERLGLPQAIVTDDAASCKEGWRADLSLALHGLFQLRAAHHDLLAAPGPALVTLPRCSSALATLPNLAAAHPDALVVWLDAHADLNTPASTCTGYLGGMVLSAGVGWWESGLGAGLAADNVILGGSRDFDPFERNLVDEGVIKLAAGETWLDDLDGYLGDRPVYIHLDCDVLEPGIVPTEYEVPDGWSLDDLRAAAERLAANPVLGVEIAELEVEDDDTPAAVAALLDALAPVLT